MAPDVSAPAADPGSENVTRQAQPSELQPNQWRALAAVCPVATAPADGRQRAPTLMAGATDGVQGAVRVWAPERGLIIRQAVLSGVVCLLGAAALLFVNFGAGLLPGLVGFLPLWLVLTLGLGIALAVGLCLHYVANTALALPALWRPCYVSTDDAGMGVTEWRGSRAMRWDQVTCHARYDLLRYILVYTREGGVAAINTCGYPRETVDGMTRIIVSKAGLTQTDRTRWRKTLFGGAYSGYLRPGFRLTASDRVIGAGSFAAAAPPIETSSRRRVELSDGALEDDHKDGLAQNASGESVVLPVGRDSR